MLPLRDNIPPHSFPFMNYGMIGLCTIAFLVQLTEPPDQSTIVEKFGMIPARVSNPGATIEIKHQEIVETDRGPSIVEKTKIAASARIPAWLTMLTCIFLHGGWMHFLGNMWFLHIFGDNVEDRFGHVGYAIFYLAAGAAASLSHFMVDPQSTIPTIGASGAIAGVMGAYMWLYPHAQVMTLVPITIILQVMALPAPLFLGIWFLIQLFQGTMASGATGVAWWAHIGGFVLGFIVAAVMGRTHHLRPPVYQTRPNSDRFSHQPVQIRRPRY